MDDNLARAIELIKIGDKASARELLRDFLRKNPHNEDAWVWLSGVLTESNQRRLCLNNALKINPENESAKRALEILESTEADRAEPPKAKPASVDPEPLRYPPSFGQPAPAKPPKPRAKPLSGLDKLMGEMTDSLYNVQGKVSQLKAKYPQLSVVAAGGTKARRFGPGEEVSLNRFGWALARRDALILTNRMLFCGSWEIMLSEVSSATITPIPASLSQGLLLQVNTYQDEKYVFGLMYHPAWFDQTVLDLELKKRKFFIGDYSGRLLLLLMLLCWGLMACGNAFNVFAR